MGQVDGLEPQWEWTGAGCPSPTIDPLGWSIKVTVLDDREGLRQQPLERRAHLTMSPKRHMDDRWVLSPPDAQLALLVRILLVTRKLVVTVDKGTV